MAEDLKRQIAKQLGLIVGLPSDAAESASNPVLSTSN